MTIKLGAFVKQEISVPLRRNDMVEFEDGYVGVVNSVVLKKHPLAVLRIHTIQLIGGGWRAAVQIVRKN